MNRLMIVSLSIIAIFGLSFDLCAMDCDKTKIDQYQEDIVNCFKNKQAQALKKIMATLYGKTLLVQSIFNTDYNFSDTSLNIVPLPIYLIYRHHDSKMLQKLFSFFMVHGCNINIRALQESNNTSLSMAIAFGDVEFVKFLLVLGADETMYLNDRDCTCLQFAKKSAELTNHYERIAIYTLLKNPPSFFECYMTERQKEKYKDSAPYFYKIYEKRKYEPREIAARNRYEKKLLQQSLVGALIQKKLCNMKFKLPQ